MWIEPLEGLLRSNTLVQVSLYKWLVVVNSLPKWGFSSIFLTVTVLKIMFSRSSPSRKMINCETKANLIQSPIDLKHTKIGQKIWKRKRSHKFKNREVSLFLVMKVMYFSFVPKETQLSGSRDSFISKSLTTRPRKLSDANMLKATPEPARKMFSVCKSGLEDSTVIHQNKTPQIKFARQGVLFRFHAIFRWL